MKKLFCILLCFALFIASAFAVRNTGDYTLETVDSKLCSSFISYLRRNKLLSDFTSYGIYQDDNGTWIVQLSDSDSYYDITIHFYSDNISFLRFSDVDFSNVENSVLYEAINKTSLNYTNWATFLYLDDTYLASALQLTAKGMTTELLVEELYKYKELTRIGFSEIVEAINAE